MKRFFGEPATLWPSMRNRLHVYVLPGDELRSALVERQRALDDVDYCSVQPAEYLHATVQQLSHTNDEADPAAVERFIGRLGDLAASTKPFTVPLAAPVVDDFSLGVRGPSTPEWSALLDGVRAAAAETVNAGLPIPNPPFAPHVTLGYGVAEGSGERIQRASDALGGPVPPLAVAGLHFLAVHQDTERGRFTWDTTTELAFGR
ncbi:hypothetical protein [Sinomonas sp. ASV322]|uniref:2'-5' RNA ligase family protein n=1 Tax=Sinomonas sp. ASV322 TaxID=3041920 RepID=UPI0027DDC9E5|nr:hypothetical protein [Sinomonas sp. ASV322]MDQ4504094.1 hypothetical protein [Sinomonas sp. ASV322]